VENCFNSFYAFRGYAKPKDIIRYSEAYDKYQRNLNGEHTQAIAQYFHDGKYVFSPEVILAYSVEDWWDESLNPSFCGEGWCGGGVSPVDYLVNNNSVSKHQKVVLKDSAGIQVSKLSTNFGENVNLVRMSLPDNLTTLPFRRIDGNHRIKAMSLIEGQKADYQIPICIVFLKADFFEGQTDTDINTVKTEAMIFHNINTKQIPLTSEENLQVIIGNDSMFSDDELKNTPSFGHHYFLTRKLLKEEILANYRYMARYITEQKYSFFVNLFRCLITNNHTFENDEAFRELITRFVDIETALKELYPVPANNNIAIIGAIAYYRISEPKKYLSFVKWATKNHLGDVNNIHIDDIIGIYNKVYENMPKKVFLARWYPDESNSERTKAEQRLTAIRTAVESYDLKLELVDMGSRDAGTFSIREAINQELPISDIFIADLTGVRPNVMVEVGMALKNLPAGRTLFYFHSTPGSQNVPFDLSGYQYFLINDSRDIDDNVVPALRNILDSIKNGG
jgi:hypothetical protein